MISNERGFTLAELLAIIAILAIITLIAAPNMTEQIKKQEEENQNVLNNKIENAAHLYVAKYYADKIVSSSSEPIKFTLEDLEKDGLLRLKANECKGARKKIIEVTVSTYKYDYSDIKTGGAISNCYD